MCVGFAKEIANWACPQENSRREAMLSQWGAMLHGDAQPATEPAGTGPMREMPRPVAPMPPVIDPSA